MRVMCRREGDVWKGEGDVCASECVSMCLGSMSQ